MLHSIHPHEHNVIIKFAFSPKKSTFTWKHNLKHKLTWLKYNESLMKDLIENKNKNITDKTTKIVTSVVDPLSLDHPPMR